MVRLAMSPELSAWVTARVAAFPDEAPEYLRRHSPSVAEFAALPLYEGWWDMIAIRPDGEIVCWITEIMYWHTEDEYPGIRPVDDRYRWLTALVEATKRYYPELRPLLPERPMGAKDCRHPPYPIFAEGKLFCPWCFGLGWVEVTS